MDRESARQRPTREVKIEAPKFGRTGEYDLVVRKNESYSTSIGSLTRKDLQRIARIILEFLDESS